MKTSIDGVNLIKGFESFSATRYLCPAGKLTIGYGHEILPDETFPAKINESFACVLLDQDIEKVERSVNLLVDVPVSQQQFNALVSFTFEEGARALKGSTLLRELNDGNYWTAADEFLKWDKCHVDGVLTEVRGIKRRRVAERAMFLEGTHGGTECSAT